MSRNEWHPNHSGIRLIHSASSLNCLQACPRQFQLKYVEGWRKRTPGEYDDAARFGTIVHAAFNELDVCRVEGAGFEESLLQALRVGIELCEDEHHYTICAACEECLPLDYPEICPKCRTTLKGQVDSVDVVRNISWWTPEDNRYKLHTLVRTIVWGADSMESGNIKPVEALNANPEAEGEEFLVEFPRSYDGEKYWLRGFFDGVAEIPPYESRYVRERKTTTKTVSGAGYKAGFAPNTQIELYSWAAPIWAKVKGFEGNFVGVLLDAFQAAVGFSRSARFTLKPSEDVLEEFKRDVDWWLLQAESYAAGGYWPKNRSSCFLCSFKKVCSAPFSAREGLLRKDFERENYEHQKSEG